MKLVGGANSTESRVEVCLNHGWDTVPGVMTGGTMLMPEWSVDNWDSHATVSQQYTLVINLVPMHADPLPCSFQC